MNQKKILIISRSFYPQNSPRSFRTTELVKEFARKGHNVTVYIYKNNKEHIPFEKKYGVKIKNIGTKRFSIFNISNGHKYVVLFKRVLNRLLLQLFEYPNIELMFKIKKILKKELNYDLLISIAAPHPIHWGVAWSRTKKHPIAKIWVADCGDPFMGATLDSFKKLFYFRYIEKWWCKKTDYISIPFKGAIHGYYKEFHKKIKIIPQGFDFNELNLNPSKYSENSVPTFAYAGGLIPARDPKKLIEYLLGTKKDFKFIFYTKQLNFIAPFFSKANGKIEIRDYVPREELLSQLSRMDFIINFENGISTQLPSKLIDYYLTKRPVLSLNTLDFDKNRIDEFLNRNYSDQYIYDNVNQYRIENVSDQFLELINNGYNY